MQLKAEKQDSAIKKAARLMDEAEKKRAAIRFERGLLELENSRFAILKNIEFAETISKYLYDNFTDIDTDKGSILIDKLFTQLVKGETNDRKIILPIFEKIGTAGLEGSNIRLLQFMCYKYSKAITDQYFDILLSVEICQFLAKSAIYFIRSNKWGDVENLLSVLWEIRSTSFDTSAGPVEPVPDILSHMATNEAIEKILQYHNNGNSDIQAKARKSIRCLGDNAVVFLLNRLIHSVTKEERFHIIGLIGGLGGKAVSAIRKSLEQELPWYVIRNIIYIIAEIGETENYPLIAEHLNHSDIRVQQQVVACIVKLGGSEVEIRLLRALSTVHDEIKMKLVMQLGAFKGEEIANGLVDLLHKKDTFQEEIRKELFFRICVSLRSFPFPNVVNLLKHLLLERKNTYGRNDQIIIAIQETINILEPRIRHSSKGEKNITDNLSYDFYAEMEQQGTGGVTEFLSEINSILKKGEREKASTLIYKKILGSAKSKDFHTAEILRDKLLDINPDALQDVIRAAEIIEEEKNRPITSHHIETWEDLYDTMSTEEFDAFYNSLKHEVYRPGESIATRGEVDACLYFINTGIVRLSCKSGKDETFLRRLKAGDVIGVSQFFSVSVWTETLIAQDSSQLHVLSRDDFLQINDKFPELEEKLYDFCRKKDDIPGLVQMSGSDRRNYARYPINVTVNNILLDPYGGSAGKRVFQGEMLDISRGGLSFSIRISKKENANLLLGRQIICEINLRGSEVLKCFGAIVGVRYQHAIVKEFSVHIKFYSEIEQRQVTDVLNLVI